MKSSSRITQRLRKRIENGGCFYIALPVLILSLIAGLTWRWMREETLQEYIKRVDPPIEALLETGTRQFSAAQYEAAERTFREALRLSTLANKESNRIYESQRKPFEESDTPKTIDPAALITPPGITYFQKRISDASYMLASTLWWQLTDKYERRLQNEKHRFTPPEAEVTPILTIIDKALDGSPGSGPLRLLQAEILRTMGQYTEAISTLEVALKQNPQFAEAHNELGLIYINPLFMRATNSATYRERARLHFEKASQLPNLDGNPFPDPFFNLGMFYMANPDPLKPPTAPPPEKDAQKAIESFETYLQYAPPDTPVAARAKAYLERLRKQ